MAHLLLVEDDDDLREAVAELLRLEGWEVSVARHGEEALVRLRDGARPAVILLDLMMPVMSGAEFRQAQRADPALAAIPVVLMTAVQGGRAAADELAAEGYFPKPVDLDALLGALQRYR